MRLILATTLPVPASYHAATTAMWLFTLWAGGFAVLTLPYVIYRLVKHDDPVALLAWLGGFICSLVEPMLDHLGHLWWPTNLPGPAFKGYNLNVPLLIPPCYVFFISMTGYFAYRMMKRGISARGVWLVWLGISSTDLALEWPGVLAHVYKYYGLQPFDVGNFPMHWAWMNGTSMLGVGVVLYYAVPRLRGKAKGLLVLAPVIGFTAAYGIVGWPAFMSINSSFNLGLMDLVDLGSLALALLFVGAVAASVGVRTKAPTSLSEPTVVSATAGGDSARQPVMGT